MSQPSIQDILPRVQMPSRYLGDEVNRIQKSWDETTLHVALAFPDLYEIATSHFGIQILYTMLNGQEDILAERVFAPAVDMEKQLRQNKLPLCSLESEIPIKNFDIIGFSLLYELNYTNLVNMLDLAGLRFFSSQRKAGDPLVIGGGPCTCNPEPVADFFDAIVVGDGEAVILQMTETWKAWRQSQRASKTDLLQRWSHIKGVYIPSFFDVAADIDGDGTTAQRPGQKLIPKVSSHLTVERAVVADLNDAPFPHQPIIPFGRPVHDRLRMEIARGCTRGCRFCQAGMIYRPVRERQPDAVLASVRQSLKATGYEDLSLLSLSTGDYSCIAPLMKNIMQYGARDRVAVSLPSLRAGSLTPELMELVRKVRKTGFTIAPEAGSQRLRDVINKNISEADIVETVENAFALGWKLIKLYFMIGLPTETQDDIKAIVDLVKQLKSVANKHGSAAKINVSVATFVPKPHTPFQWEAQIRLDAAIEKINWLKDKLKLPGVQVKWQDPRVSMIEGVWARGDRKLNQVLIEAWQSGCRFDGWTDFFNFEHWQTVFKKVGIDPNDYTSGYADTRQPLPWDHINIGVTLSYLASEKERAIAGEITKDCRTGSCSGCGVCDFDTLQPVSYHDNPAIFSGVKLAPERETSDTPIHYVVNFQKMNKARFLGHLEMVKLFTRGLRRANIPVNYSHGFHPMPKVSFGDTLPMGMQSEDEQMRLSLSEPMDPEELVACLRRQIPSGLEITGCGPYVKRETSQRETLLHYLVQLNDGFFHQKDLDWFFSQQFVNIQRKSKKGKVVIVDLKKAIDDIQLLDNRHARMTLGMDNNLTVRPAQVMETIFKLTPQQILRSIITKKKPDRSRDQRLSVLLTTLNP